jgi:hypothetical protein
MKKIIFPLLIIFFFLALKISNNSIRLSDTNIYFNIAYQMFQGKILYKDIFLSNFPFFYYVSFFYYLITQRNIDLFYLTSAIEVAITTFLIYLITIKKTKNYGVSIISSALYIFSFMVLSTSDHQTGVFTASLLGVIGYYFLQEKKYLMSGIFMALTFLTKAYFLPIFLSFFLYITVKKGFRNLTRFIIGLTLTSLLVLALPLIQAPKEFFSDIFGFSLTRPVGLPKMNIFWFFITKDFYFFFLLLFNFANFRKNIFFGLITVFSILFFFGYQDVYYLYLNFLAPFLSLSFYEFYSFSNVKFNLQKLVIPTIILIIIALNLLTYVSGYRNLGKLSGFNSIIEIIKKENPKYLYGTIDITPALISILNIPALENVNGAHEYFFERGIYDKKKLTDKAVNTRTIIITHGADYPQYGIKQEIFDNIFASETIYDNCKNILSVPVIAEGDVNRINLFKCY